MTRDECMVRCLSKLVQMPVLHYYSGKKLGAAGGFYIDPESHRLLGVLVRKYRWSGPILYRMGEINKDSSRMSLLVYADAGEKKKDNESEEIGFPLCLGTSAMRERRIGGQIADIWVDWSDFSVVWYEISIGYLDDLRQGRTYARGYWVKTAKKKWIFQCVQEV